MVLDPGLLNSARTTARKTVARMRRNETRGDIATVSPHPRICVTGLHFDSSKWAPFVTQKITRMRGEKQLKETAEKMAAGDCKRAAYSQNPGFRQGFIQATRSTLLSFRTQVMNLEISPCGRNDSKK